MIGTAARDGEGGQDERRASESRREKYGHGQGDLPDARGYKLEECQGRKDDESRE